VVCDSSLVPIANEKIKNRNKTEYRAIVFSFLSGFSFVPEPFQNKEN
jgi:hypothetical protein